MLLLPWVKRVDKTDESTVNLSKQTPYEGYWVIIMTQFFQYIAYQYIINLTRKFNYTHAWDGINKRTQRITCHITSNTTISHKMMKNVEITMHVFKHYYRFLQKKHPNIHCFFFRCAHIFFGNVLLLLIYVRIYAWSLEINLHNTKMEPD